jgi:hypothetical protein
VARICITVHTTKHGAVTVDQHFGEVEKDGSIYDAVFAAAMDAALVAANAHR